MCYIEYKSLLRCKGPVLAFIASQNTAELSTVLELSHMCSDHTEEATEKTPRKNANSEFIVILYTHN